MKEGKRARQTGKSDAIDALNVARAALQEGLDSFPAAHLDGPEDAADDRPRARTPTRTTSNAPATPKPATPTHLEPADTPTQG